MKKKTLFLMLIIFACIFVIEFRDHMAGAENAAGRILDYAGVYPVIDTGLTKPASAQAEARIVGRIVAGFNRSLDAEEAERIAGAVIMYSRQYGVDPCLVAAVIIVESNGVVTAVSDKGAVGLMQVMPYMARDMGFEGDLFDIEDNIRIGVFILANNIRMWGRSEGIQRYFWGNMPISDGRYIAKVEKALQEINALGSTGANAG